jgi:hypothetical protein
MFESQWSVAMVMVGFMSAHRLQPAATANPLKKATSAARRKFSG